MVSIRPEISPERQHAEFENWGKYFQMVYKTGKSAVMASTSDLETQADWLIKQNPEYVLSLPTNIKTLVAYFADNRLELPSIEEVRTYGEVADEEVFKLVKEIWGVPVHDMYSTQEVGYIALQCNEYGNYHIQSENVLVEIINDNGNLCKPGETGRVVVTTMHNYCMPLIRYAIGDYAEVGEPCPCGRGLPVLKRILGRERNMVTMPDGRRHYPSFPSESWAQIAPIRQIQLVQKSLNQIEARLVIDRKMSNEEEVEFIAKIQERLKYAFNISITYHDEIKRSKGGKYEDFISELDT